MEERIKEEKMLEPIANAFSLPDPRVSNESGVTKPLGIVAFYYPGKESVVDEICNAGFLGNFWKLNPSICLTAPCLPEVEYTFTNSEAAFQALKFWDKASEFESLSGDEAFRKKRSRGFLNYEDRSYAGFGSNWAGMFAVLEAKYAPGSEMAQALLQTGDSFLLEHNDKVGRDAIWSNNYNGEGQNWLGLQLMIIRDKLRNLSGDTWTSFISNVCKIDLKTGPLSAPKKIWQDVVREATKSVLRTIDKKLRDNV